MSSKHLIDLDDFPLSRWNKIIDTATEILKNPKNYYGTCTGKILATLFYEPSTRTQMSFQTAMLRLGGHTIGFDNPLNTSVSKGENLKDTIKVISGYADMIVMRNPMEGSAKAAALYADCPVINAGDGGHLHPTQTLTDLVTLKAEKGTLHNLTIGLCGDLLNGRTVHSLIKAMCRYDAKFILISTSELTVPQYIKDLMDSAGCPYTQINRLEDAMPMLDVLYMTRIQRERFANELEYLRQKNVYVLDKQKLKAGKSDLKILHPLPRVDEITLEVDDDPRAVYFKQAVYGVYARMALILDMFEQMDTTNVRLSREHSDVCCTNPKCITAQELYLPKIFSASADLLICDYCDQRILI